jgi:hypothetical protein
MLVAVCSVFELFIDKRVSLSHAFVTLYSCRGFLLIIEVGQNKFVDNVCIFVQVIVECATWSVIKVCDPSSMQLAQESVQVSNLS